MSALSIITNDIYSARDNFASVLTDRSLNFEREAGFAIQSLTANDYAMGIAQKNRQSVINAVTNIAAIGISLNPAKKQAYLVPRDGRICLDISYIGLLDLAIGSGSIRWGQAELVYEGDAFTLNGFDKPPTHGRNPFDKNRGEVIGVYVVVKTADGDYLTTTMTIDEVNAIRDRSSAWKAWISKQKSCPWVTDPGEMAKKTVIKRAYKLWPKTERLEQAIHHLNTDGDEGLAPEPSAPAKVDVVPMIAAAIATKTDAEALAYWKANNGKLAKQPGDHARLKEAVMQHRTKLKEQEQIIDVPEMPLQNDAPPVDDGFVAAMDAAGEQQ